MNLLHIQELIESIAKKHISGDVLRTSNLINQKDRKYPCVAFDLMRLQNYDDTSIYNYQFTIAIQCDNYNNVDAHFNQEIDIMTAILEDFETEGIIVGNPIDYQFNTLKFADVLDIALVNVNLTVNNDVDCL